jgi:hypothetical protein
MNTSFYDTRFTARRTGSDSFHCQVLTEERIADVTPVIPLDKCFWPISSKERKAIQ